jgi:hypothetical protein
LCEAAPPLIFSVTACKCKVNNPGESFSLASLQDVARLNKRLWERASRPPPNINL